MCTHNWEPCFQRHLVGPSREMREPVFVLCLTDLSNASASQEMCFSDLYFFYKLVKLLGSHIQALKKRKITPFSNHIGEWIFVT